MASSYPSEISDRRTPRRVARDTPAPDFFRWAWQQVGTKIPNLRGEANLAIFGHDRTHHVTARLISERASIDVRGTGDDAIAAVQNLLRSLPGDRN